MTHEDWYANCSAWLKPGGSFMDENRIFGGTIDIATKALDLRSRRHEVIASNIANADTPGYKAFDVLVDEALQKSSSKHSDSMSVKQTHPGHLPAKAIGTRNLDEPMIQHATNVSLRGDGNTVDMDREMSNLAANQLLYKATARIMSKKFEGLLHAIRGGKQ
jgi:flagellar basal-body rod protein FlgB